MKIVNGFGEIVDGKYKAAKADLIETIRIIDVFEQKVTLIINKYFGDAIKYNDISNKYTAMLQQSSSYLWTPTINLNGPNYQVANGAFVHISTGINSNGYSTNIAKRHFVIGFSLKGKVRYKYQKQWENDCSVISCHLLSDNLDDVLDEFECWLNEKYKSFVFFRISQNLRYNK